MTCYMNPKDPFCIYLYTFGEATNVYMDYETQYRAHWEFYVTCINVLETHFVLDNTARDTPPEGMIEHPEDEIAINQEVFSNLM